MELGHRLGELVDRVRRRRLREHGWDHAANELRWRKIGRLETARQTLLDNICGKGAGPSRVRAGEQKCHRDDRTPAIELERERAAERQAAEVNRPQAERVQEAGKAV